MHGSQWLTPGLAARHRVSQRAPALRGTCSGLYRINQSAISSSMHESPIDKWEDLLDTEWGEALQRGPVS